MDSYEHYDDKMSPNKVKPNTLLSQLTPLVTEDDREIKKPPLSNSADIRNGPDSMIKTSQRGTRVSSPTSHRYPTRAHFSPQPDQQVTIYYTPESDKTIAAIDKVIYTAFNAFYRDLQTRSVRLYDAVDDLQRTIPQLSNTTIPSLRHL